MRAVDKLLKDKKYTGVYAYLSDHDFRLFRKSVREKIRREYLWTSTNTPGFSDANFESWPQGVAHNYVCDAKRVILETITETWDALFASPPDHDECLLIELVYPAFYD
ncbi:hypothetical protein BJ166DRAFT_504613 [Pestalotiopsis sp. NC0098]|nr:hypothetical protein BJ166DRAFT_504613 [Pestalotiopsis sp. NC0098]